MKNIIKFAVVNILGLIARAVVKKYKPSIVMISGSVGKTSTKDAVATVLDTNFLVRKSDKSFNSEFGVPFTILGVKNPWRDPLAWATIIKNSLALLLLPNHYPNMLVLEVAAGKPKDLELILRILAPNAVVITRLPDIPVHVEAYASPEAVREEEFSPAYTLPAAAPLIIPSDDSYATSKAVGTPAHIISYGASENSTVRIIDAGYYEEGRRVVGMQATVIIGVEKHRVIVKGSVGSTQLLPIAAAIGTGFAFNIAPADAIKALARYEPPPGRGRIFRGVNDSTIIDDTYNSSPAAVEEALVTLKTFPHAKRRIAILGDMLELGRYSVTEHERIGLLAKESADIVIAVGIRSRALATANGSGGVTLYDNSRAAADALPALVHEGDVILVKGSQSIRTERIVEALLANSSDSVKLVRQEREWKRIP